MLRFLHILVKLVTAAGLITICALIGLYGKEQVFEYSVQYWDQFLASVGASDENPGPYREILMTICGVGVLGLLLPLLPARQKKAISFSGSNGQVTIELESIEPTLERVALKLPEVKSIAVVLEPPGRKKSGNVQVEATAVLEKTATEDARAVTMRVENYLLLHTQRFLGIQNVQVNLRVKRFRMSMKTLKSDTLLLEAPKHGDASMSGGAVPADVHPERDDSDVADENTR